ncbi:hypothetical protein HDU86_004124 [Geranomyces michiganensis]|nr:hypothetical protein HDU86_004124 [Geranomyces michiganensis]
MLFSAQNYGSSFVKGTVSEALRTGVKILTQQSFNANGNLDDDDLMSVIASIKNSNARIIIATALEDEFTALWIKAYKAGLVTSDYVWVTVNGILDFPGENPDEYYYQYRGRTVADVLGPEVANATGVLFVGIQGDNSSTPEYEIYKQQWNETLTPEEHDPKYNDEDGYDAGYYNEENVWDCAMAIFYGFDELLKANASLNAAMLVHPDYTAPKDRSVPWNMQPFTNVSIFNTMKKGLAGPYLFEAGNYPFEKSNILATSNGAKVNGTYGTYPVVAYFTGERGDNIVLQPEEFSFFGKSKVTPPDIAPPERFNPAWESSQGAGFSAIAVALLLVHLASGATVFNNRHKAVIKRGSWKSLSMIAFGLGIIDIAPLLYVGTVNKAVCVAQPFVLNIGFGLVFSNLMAKTWRVFRIFNNRKMMGKPISDGQIFAFSGAIFFVECLMSIIWVAVSTPVPTTFWLNDLQLVVVCQSPNESVQVAMTGICIAFNALLLTLTTVLSFSTRKVVSEYNETKWIGMSVYNIVAVSALFIPLVYTTAFASYAFPLRNIALLMGSGVTGFCIFGPKFLVLLRSRHKRPAAQATSYSRALMATVAGSSSAKVYVAGSRNALPQRGTVAQARRVQSLQLASVPCLLSGTGGVFGFITRWRNANIISSPGCLCVEFLEDGMQSGKILAFRTENAICRNGTTAGTGSAIEGSRISQADLAEKGVQNESSHSTEPHVTPQADEKDVTFIIVTLDGTLELAVTASIAVDLGKHIMSAPGAHGTAKASTSASEHQPSVRKSHMPNSP